MEVYDELFTRFRVSRGSQAQICFQMMEAFFGGRQTIETGVPVIYTPTGEERWIRPARFAKGSKKHTMKFEIQEAKDFTEKLGHFRRTDRGFFFDLHDIDTPHGQYIYEYLSDGLDDDRTNKTKNDESRATWWRTTRLTGPQQVDFISTIDLKTVADRAAYVVREQRVRRDQGLFHKIQRREWAGRCPITYTTDPKMLVAAHLKNYPKCIGLEHIDRSNGILLSYLFIRPLDEFYITFDLNGKIIYAPDFGGAERQAIINAAVRAVPFQQRHYPFLIWHQDRFQTELLDRKSKKQAG